MISDYFSTQMRLFITNALVFLTVYDFILICGDEVQIF